MICNWKFGKEVKLQMKLDTIDKHAGKVYEMKFVNSEKKYIIKWKYYEECKHVKFADEYKKYLISKGKIKESGGTITSLLGKSMEINLLSKTTRFDIIFHVSSRGHPMINYPKYMKYLSLLEVLNLYLLVCL
jgi:hypothetical protein